MANLSYWDGNEEVELAANNLTFWDGQTPYTLTANNKLSYWNGTTELPIFPVDVVIPEPPAPSTPTQTTLTVTPNNTAIAGTTITMQVTVTPSAATGTVTFRDGTTTLRTMAVSNGTASTSTTSLNVGSHSLTATFTPANTAIYAGSTSTAKTYIITATATVVTTNTTLTVTPNDFATVGATVTLQAAVTPSNAAGTVTFLDGETSIGQPIAVTSGNASTTTTSLVVGAHSLAAVFTPTNEAAFTSSASGDSEGEYTISASTPDAPVFNTSTMGPAGITVGTPFNRYIDFQPNSLALTLTISAGELPAGLALSSQQTISGTPTTAGPYAFTIMATNSAGSSTREFTGTVQAAAVTIPPAPTGLTSPSKTQTTVTLSWSVSAGATSYQVYRGDTQLISTGDTTYVDTGRSANATYTYRVRASNASGQSAYSSQISVTTNATPVGAPTAPTGLASPNQTQTTIDLTWTAVAGATSYNVYRNDASIGTPTTNSFTDTGRSASTTYRYKVRASNSSGQSPYSAEISATTNAAPSPIGGQPTVRRSYGPNGTHWPRNTPWVGNTTWDFQREVNADWSAIKTAINEAAATASTAKCIIRVRPGTLPGNGLGSSSAAVISGAGGTRTTRILVVPRDGAFSVNHSNGLKLENVKGVAFVGFSPWNKGADSTAAYGISVNNCSNLAWAWSKTKHIFVRATTGRMSDLDFVEIVSPEYSVVTGKTDRYQFSVSGDSSGRIDRVLFEGTYTAPCIDTSAYSDILQMYGAIGSPPDSTATDYDRFSEFVLRDTVFMFDQSQAIMYKDNNGIEMDRVAIIGDDKALVRHPRPAAALSAAKIGGKFPVNWRGNATTVQTGLTAKDVYLTGTNVARFGSVVNSKSNVSQPGGNFTVDSSVANSAAWLNTTFGPAPTDALMQQWWGAL